VRRNDLQCPSLLPQLRQQTLTPSSPLVCPDRPQRRRPRLPQHVLTRPLLSGLLVLCLALGFAGIGVPSALAAEILGIPTPTRLRVGDQNRGYLVDLACIAVEDTDSQAALEWLRGQGSRGTRVNLRPLGTHDGVLVANVRILSSGLDLGEGLVAQGLATALPCPETNGQA
jgi:hypothetical protein